MPSTGAAVNVNCMIYLMLKVFFLVKHCLLRYISIVCFFQLIKHAWENLQTRSKIENPHSAINYLSYKSPGIMQILLVSQAIDIELPSG